MATELVVVDLATGTCGTATLRKYPVVVGNPASTVTSTVLPNGGTQYTVTAPASSVTNTIAGNVIATHTSGTGVVTPIRETVTSLVRNGTGFVYTNEAGVVTTVPVCSMLAALPNIGVIG